MLLVFLKVMRHSSESVSVHSFAKARVYWFVCQYVLNLQYCKQAKEVATFFQEYAFGFPDKSKNVLHISVFV